MLQLGGRVAQVAGGLWWRVRGQGWGGLRAGWAAGVAAGGGRESGRSGG